MNKKDLIIEMKKFGLDKNLQEKISSVMIKNNCYQLAIELGKKPKTGDSKIGGVPDFPVGFEWPEPNGKPFKFIGQLNLKDFPVKSNKTGSDVGLLYFFLFDEDYPPLSKVLFSNQDSKLEPSVIHDMLPAIDISDPVALKLISRDDWLLPLYDFPLFNSLDLSEEQRYAYEDFEYETELDYPGKLVFEGCQALSHLTPSAVNALHDNVNEEKDPFMVLLSLDPFDNNSYLRKTLENFNLNRRFFFYIKKSQLLKMDFENCIGEFGES